MDHAEPELNRFAGGREARFAVRVDELKVVFD